MKSGYVLYTIVSVGYCGVGGPVNRAQSNAALSLREGHKNSFGRRNQLVIKRHCIIVLLFVCI